MKALPSRLVVTLLSIVLTPIAIASSRAAWDRDAVGCEIALTKMNVSSNGSPVDLRYISNFTLTISIEKAALAREGLVLTGAGYYRRADRSTTGDRWPRESFYQYEVTDFDFDRLSPSDGLDTTNLSLFFRVYSQNCNWEGPFVCTSEYYQDRELALFAKVEDASGRVGRIWFKDGSYNFNWTTSVIGYPFLSSGNHEFILDPRSSSPLFDVAKACGRI